MRQDPTRKRRKIDGQSRDLVDAAPARVAEDAAQEGPLQEITANPSRTRRRPPPQSGEPRGAEDDRLALERLNPRARRVRAVEAPRGRPGVRALKFRIGAPPPRRRRPSSARVALRARSRAR